MYNRLNRRARLISVSIIVAFFAATSVQAERYQIKDWKWSEGDDASRASPECDDSTWDPVSLPKEMKLTNPGEIFWLRTDFSVPQSAPPKLWFLTGKGGVALELYANGVYCGSRGRVGPRFDLRATHCAAIMISPPDTHPGELLHLALRCEYQGSRFLVPSYQIGGEAEMEYELGPANFWNGRLYAILSALCIFLSIYSLLQYLFKRNETENLFFALALLFCSFYLLDLGAEMWIFKAVWSRALARASLVVSMAFLAPFFSKFFGYKLKVATKYSFFGSSAACAVAVLINAGDDTALAMAFNVALLPVMVSIALCAIMSVRAVRSGKHEAIPVLIAVVIGIALASHDAYYTVKGTDPFAWLQGIAFFTLDISIFVALAMRQTTLKAELVRYSKEVEAKKAELAQSLSNLGEAGVAAAELARRLEESAEKAAKAAEEAASKSESIGKETARQASEAEESDRLVGDLVLSIERVHASLSAQTESADGTASAAIELQSGAESVAQSIDRTAAFMGNLAAMTATGEKAASALAEAMARVADASVGIGEVVDAVNDFAERTNLLAMNAAIEATHSGQYGRGFTVIAGEVKKLAIAQSDRAARIKEIVAEISGRVSEGAKDAENLRSTLREIASGSKEADGRIEEVRCGTAEQKRASEDISSSMEALAAAIASIREETDRQAEYSGKVRDSVAAIAAGAAEVRSSARSIAEESASLVDAVLGLREMTAKGGELTAALAGWSDEGKRD
jgi:hypothetical protein